MNSKASYIKSRMSVNYFLGKIRRAKKARLTLAVNTYPSDIDNESSVNERN